MANLNWHTIVFIIIIILLIVYEYTNTFFWNEGKGKWKGRISFKIKSYKGRDQPHLNKSWGKTTEVQKKKKSIEYIWTEKKQYNKL